MGVETYLYGFDGDIYDTFITVRLESFVRPERKFSGLSELQEQLKKDIVACAGSLKRPPFEA